MNKKEEKDTSISLGYSRTKEVVPVCSICHVSTQKQLEKGEYKCPLCQRIYFPDREIMEYPDTIRSSHDDEMPEIEGIGGGTELMADNEESAASDLYKAQKRLGVHPNENVIEYWEYIPDRE